MKDTCVFWCCLVVRWRNGRVGWYVTTNGEQAAFSWFVFDLRHASFGLSSARWISIFNHCSLYHLFVSSFFFLSSSFSIMNNSKTMVYTNVLYTKEKRCYRRSSLSGLELYANYNWWARDPNTHHYLFLTHHFVCTCISSITWKLWNACNCATYQTTPLLLRILCFILKGVEQ